MREKGNKYRSECVPVGWMLTDDGELTSPDFSMSTSSASIAAFASARFVDEVTSIRISRLASVTLTRKTRSNHH